MNNNYILARLRDAVTDPPNTNRVVIIRREWATADGCGTAAAYFSNLPGWKYEHDGRLFQPEPGDQWLDITAIPGVAREAVQAAVDEITKYADEIPGTRCARGLKWARQLIKSHTGVTPMEVK